MNNIDMHSSRATRPMITSHMLILMQTNGETRSISKSHILGHLPHTITLSAHRLPAWKTNPKNKKLNKTHACLTPRSPSTSSAPPRIASNFCVLWNCSMNLPIPVLVRARPPKIWTASSAISPAKRVDCILRKAICLDLTPRGKPVNQLCAR